MPARETESMCNVREANIFGAPLALHIFPSARVFSSLVCVSPKLQVTYGITLTFSPESLQWNLLFFMQPISLNFSHIHAKCWASNFTSLLLGNWQEIAVIAE